MWTDHIVVIVLGIHIETHRHTHLKRQCLRVFVDVIKHHDHQTGEESVYFIFPSLSLFITEKVKTGTETEQEAGSKS